MGKLLVHVTGKAEQERVMRVRCTGINTPLELHDFIALLLPPGLHVAELHISGETWDKWVMLALTMPLSCS